MRQQHHPYIFSKCNVTLNLEPKSVQPNVGSRAKREGERFKVMVAKLHELEKTLALKEASLFLKNI